MMILITGMAKLHAEHRDSALAAAAEMSTHSLTEHGCIDYRFWISSTDPNSFLLFELWRDRAALDAHLAAPQLSEFAAVLGGALDGGFDLTRYEIASAGPLR